MLKHEEEEMKLRAIFAPSLDAITVIDLEGNITECNQTTLDMLGYSSKDEVIGKNGFELVAEKDRQRAMENLKKVLKQGSMRNIEYTALTKDGHEFPVELSASVVKDSSGNPIGVIGIIKDITERKRAEEELTKSEIKYRSLVEGAGSGIATVDSEGRFTFVNKALCKMIGYSEEEMIGKSFVDFLHPDEKERILQLFLSAWRGPNRKAHLEFGVIHKKGHIVHMYSSPTVIKYKDKIVGFNAIIHNITERKKAEIALRESEEKYRTQFEEAMDAIFVADAETGILVDCNRAASKLVGKEKSELVGKHQRILHPPEEIEGEFSRTFKQHLKEKEGQVLEAQVITKKGEIKEVAIKANVFKLGDKKLIQGIFRDITDQKKMEEALKESERKLRDIIDTSPDAVIWVDTTGKITLVNKKGFELTGYSEKDLIGKSFMDVEALTPESKEKILESFMKRIEGIDTPPYEVEVVAKNGEIIPAELSASPIYEEGKIVGTQSIFRDLRERKRADEKLRESEERFRNLFESIQDPVGVFVGREGCLIEYNKAFKKLAGYTDEELKDKIFLDFVHPDDHALVLERYRTKYREEELPLIYEIRAVNKKGEIIPLEISVSTYKVKGKVVGIEIIHRDITERKEMEEKLRQYSEHLEELVQERTDKLLESEKRYSVLVEKASDGVAILQDGKIVFTNQKAPETVGYSRDEIVGLPFEKLVDEKYRQQAKERYMRILRGETIPATFEAELIAKTGERVPIEVSSALIHYQGSPADLIIMRDIRERKRMEEQRLKLEKLATIGELATMVGHDLRNPLQAITNAVYILKNTAMTMNSTLMSDQYEKIRNLLPEPILNEILQHVTNFLENHNEIVYTIDESTKYANKIVSDLQDFAKTREPEPIEVNLESLIHETLSDISIPENVQTSIRHDQRLSKLYVDPNHIRRVFTNLTTNAIQAMPNGGKLTISTSLKNGFASIIFQDTGVGIPKENMKKLFSPLFTTKAKGIGLGLAICKNLVEVHGGSIQVESQEGKGSTFMVKLPIQQG